LGEISPDEFKIRRHFTVIKERVEKEIHVWPSTIFDEEIRNLQFVHKVSIKAIVEHVKPFSSYKNTFENIRVKNKPKIPIVEAVKIDS
jgi:hypothetical protein